MTRRCGHVGSACRAERIAEKGVAGRDDHRADEGRGGRGLADDTPPVVPQGTPLTKSTGPVLEHRPSCVLPRSSAQEEHHV